MPAITTGGPHPPTVGPEAGASARAIGPGRPTDHDPAAADQRIPRRRSPVDRWVTVGRRAGGAVRAGQLVTAQVAAALVLVALGRPAPVVAVAVLVAVLLAAAAWVPVRGRWLFEWLGTAIGHLTRRRALTGPAGAVELLDLVAPGTVVRSTELTGGPAAVLEDTTGMVALLELGDPGDLLGDASQAIPAPAALLPDRAGPTAAAGPTSARRCTGAGAERRRHCRHVVPAAHRRASRRARTGGGGDSGAAGERLVRGGPTPRTRRHGPSDRPAARAVGRAATGVPAALRVLGELAHHDGEPVRESWSTIRSGTLVQATFRLVRWPDAGVRPDAGWCPACSRCRRRPRRCRCARARRRR